jgi:ribA/ribD-fused uncharacterized protein
VTEPILALAGDYYDWSNFGLRKVHVFGRTWATSEHAFQAAKFFGTDENHVELVAAAATPRDAKKYGRTRSVPIRRGWDGDAMTVITLIVLRKFEQHEDLAAQLVASGGARIVEGNAHGDRLWGAEWEHKSVDERYTMPIWASEEHRVLTGRNQLGRVLMVVRRELA